MKNTKQINGFINSVIMIADKFIGKVESGNARSKETYQDLLKLKAEAVLIKNSLNKSIK